MGDYTKFVDQVKKVIELVSEGSSIADALAQSQLKRTQLIKTLETVPLLAQEYARARQMRADVLAEEIIEIADNSFDPQIARNRIDARRWYASKLKPETYGDRIDLNVTQSVDIRGALDDARTRANVLPIPASYLRLASGAQPIDNTEHHDSPTSGPSPALDEADLSDLLK